MLLAAPTPAAAQDWQIPEGQLRTAIGQEAIAERFPNSAHLVRRQLGAAHSVQDAGRVRAGLARLAELGYAPTAETLDLLSRYVPEEEMAALRLRFDASRTIVQGSRLFTTIPASGRLIEGIAWDGRRDRLFASSVVGRELIYGNGESWRTVPGLGAGSLFGLGIDDPRRLLWIASGVVDQTPSPEGAFRGLIALDLDRLAVIHRIAIDGEGSPADIHVAPDGTVYAADPANGTIWRVGVGDTVASVIVPPGRFANPQGLVQSIDRRRLYVSDYIHGLAVVDLNSGEIARLASDVTTMLDGIDGLVRYGDGLIAVQNGTSPRRILYLELGDGGRRITRVETLESAHPDWGEPTLGVVRGNRFLYVADAQWERYGDGGAVTGEGPTRPTAIRELSLRGRNF